MKKINVMIAAIAMFTMMSCGNKTGGEVSSDSIQDNSTSVNSVADAGNSDNVTDNASISKEDEKAKVVKLLHSSESMYYSDVNGLDSMNVVKIQPGYYHYDTEIEDYYLVCLGQDGPYTIPKKDAEIEVWSASQGHGYVLLFNEKNETIYLKEKPSDDSKTIETFSDIEDLPEDAECLGIINEWYKVKYRNKVGYIRRDLSIWSISCSDVCGAIR